MYSRTNISIDGIIFSKQVKRNHFANCFITKKFVAFVSPLTAQSYNVFAELRAFLNIANVMRTFEDMRDMDEVDSDMKRVQSICM